jgi:hypothetical protein
MRLDPSGAIILSNSEPTQTQDTNGEGAVRYITDTTPVT